MDVRFHWKWKPSCAWAHGVPPPPFKSCKMSNQYGNFKSKRYTCKRQRGVTKRNNKHDVYNVLKNMTFIPLEWCILLKGCHTLSSCTLRRLLSLECHHQWPIQIQYISTVYFIFPKPNIVNPVSIIHLMRNVLYNCFQIIRVEFYPDNYRFFERNHTLTHLGIVREYFSPKSVTAVLSG